MIIPDARLLFIGCGKMGGALLKSVTSRAPRLPVCVVDPAAPPRHLKSLANVSWLSSLDKIDSAFRPDLIVVAVKPQQIKGVLPAYAGFKDSVFLSIAAGIPLAKLHTLLGGGTCAIVRSIPNLPASIGQGATAAIANRHVSPAQHAMCDALLNSVGETAWVEDENLIDVITALSGNGPAYVFALCEAMAEAGAALGLSPDMAMKLARQTVIGSGALLAQAPESAAILRAAVTSPGGTTEAALKHLLAASGGLPELMLKAMKAGVDRARELAQGL